MFANALTILVVDGLRSTKACNTKWKQTLLVYVSGYQCILCNVSLISNHGIQWQGSIAYLLQMRRRSSVRGAVAAAAALCVPCGRSSSRSAPVGSTCWWSATEGGPRQNSRCPTPGLEKEKYRLTSRRTQYAESWIRAPCVWPTLEKHYKYLIISSFIQVINITIKNSKEEKNTKVFSEKSLCIWYQTIVVKIVMPAIRNASNGRVKYDSKWRV